MAGLIGCTYKYACSSLRAYLWYALASKYFVKAVKFLRGSLESLRALGALAAFLVVLSHLAGTFSEMFGRR